jgi:predicted dehydrogenase
VFVWLRTSGSERRLAEARDSLRRPVVSTWSLDEIWDKAQAIVYAGPPSHLLDFAGLSAHYKRPLLAEKPFASKHVEAQLVSDLFGRAGLHGQVGYQLRYHRASDHVRLLLSSGEFGRIHQIQVVACALPSAGLQLGVTEDFACHFVDLIDYLTGSHPLDWSLGLAELDDTGANRNDSHSHIEFRHRRDGYAVNMDISRVEKPALVSRAISLSCSEGRIHLDMCPVERGERPAHAWEVTTTMMGETKVSSFPVMQPYEELVREFIVCARSQGSPLAIGTSFPVAADVRWFVDHCYENARELGPTLFS